MLHFIIIWRQYSEDNTDSTMAKDMKTRIDIGKKPLTVLKTLKNSKRFLKKTEK